MSSVSAAPASSSPPPSDRPLFGTDGVRGLANTEPVSVETAVRLGRAAAHVLTRNRPAREGRTHVRPRVVLGKDTRQSGDLLESALAAGLMSFGVDVLLVGTLPTPAVAYVTRSLRADAGVVLTASHNSFEDNGIKFFRGDGYKLDDAVERRIEEVLARGEADAHRPTGAQVGRARRVDDALGRYVEFAKATFSPSRQLALDGLRIAVDAANGAASQATPWILQELGADVLTFHNAPDGTNVNRDCGSTYPEEIQLLVRQTGAQLGITHDGDADRLLLCDERGELVDGDEIMAVAAVDLLRDGRLAQNTLAATVMSNFALDETLGAHGGQVVRTAVGDRHVIEAMVRADLNLGGEQSGHLIFRDHTTTGDGVISALQILRTMVRRGRSLHELKQVLRKYPQAQRNLKVVRTPPLEGLPEVSRLLDQARAALQGRGRVLVRYSGTESKVRLLLEGRDPAQIESFADEIAAALTAALGR